MGKVKVYELAKELGLTNNELIEKLKSVGVEVKSHLSVIDDEIVNKVRSGSNVVKKQENEKKESKKQKDKSILFVEILKL